MRRVAYVYSDELIRAADCLPANEGRASLVHSLADSYGLLASSPAGARDRPGDRTACIVPPVRATRDQLTRFHDHAFIDAILGTANSERDSESDSLDSSEEEEEETPAAPSFGLSSERSSAPSRPRKRRKDASAAADNKSGLQDDCPVFPELADYVQLVAGASIAAARELRDGRADVAIAWTGGRHHAKRAEAAGFCYVADAVLAIMELRTPPPKTSAGSLDPDTTPPPPAPPPSRISRVLYLDLDLHHGDGVESAFFSSPHVLTLSLHLFAPLFFPATGALDSTGPTGARAPAAGHALNLALEPGLGEETFERVWGSCVEKVVKAYDADAIVLQLGVDGLAGDPCKEWNLPLASFGFALERVLSWNKRTLLLGGGGYHSANAARAWTYLTSVALGRPLSLEAPIPADLPTTTYEQFAPSFTLDVPAGHVSDRNTSETLARVESAFETYAARLAARKKVQQK
ncbi:hypothetical protein C6P46_003533 [Rhodotorula mucilaginosa]|uniref:histone deacetylase n=1 Tax=Rhodotorula mucilaginosa TaxID=5537 RepID=A0A9P6W1L8_RHOMI|nr:hypothetical protein C6P46_003533 [Rhodotorula mucilaginosa]TKA58094.1 hypothetical protein B0A53_00496 [Rhodotorula sp. CCFEE 5036]